MFEFQQQEQYTFEDVQAIVTGIKSKVEETITTKDETITDLTTKVEKVEELTKSNHELNIKNLAIQNGIDEELIDLIYDADLEKVTSKIEKIKSISKEKEIDKSFKPEKKRSEDGYEKAIKNNDVEGAIKYKLGKIFG